MENNNQKKIMAILSVLAVFLAACFLLVKYCNFEYTSDYMGHIPGAIAGGGILLRTCLFMYVIKYLNLIML